MHERRVGQQQVPRSDHQLAKLLDLPLLQRPGLIFQRLQFSIEVPRFAHRTLHDGGMRPAFAATPVEIARQITAACDEARRQDRATLHQAQEMLQRAAGDLRGWVDTARLASVQELAAVASGDGGLGRGAVLGVSFPIIVAQTAPEQWAWPEKRAARVLHLDMWPAG